MSTDVRAKLSEKNKYFIPKHRFYELRHFCLQYPMWRKMLAKIDGYKSHYDYVKIPGGSFSKSNVEDTVEIREDLVRKLDLIESCIQLSDSSIAKWLFMGITQGLSYSTLESLYDIPCSKDMYYDRFRKFFWILDGKRG